MTQKEYEELMSKEQEPIPDLIKSINEYLYKEHENYKLWQKQFYEERDAMLTGAIRRYCEGKGISEQDFFKEFLNKEK